jgi:hypothetical protein
MGETQTGRYKIDDEQSKRTNKSDKLLREILIALHADIRRPLERKVSYVAQGVRGFIDGRRTAQ